MRLFKKKEIKQEELNLSNLRKLEKNEIKILIDEGILVYQVYDEDLSLIIKILFENEEHIFTSLDNGLVVCYFFNIYMLLDDFSLITNDIIIDERNKTIEKFNEFLNKK